MVTESVKQDQSNAPAAVAMLARVVAMLLWSRDDQSTMTYINFPAATAVEEEEAISSSGSQCKRPLLSSIQRDSR